jgi:hypothetical protein
MTLEQVLNEHGELLEALADIAHIAGALKFYGGDSRADIQLFIKWAHEFEEEHHAIQWGIDLDYMETIEKFADSKFKEVGTFL